MKQLFSSDMKVLRLIPVCTAALLISCQGDTGKKDRGEFTPNPRRLEAREVVTLRPGDPAPAFRLPDVSGRFYTLEDFSQSEVLVIVFTCNHCPTAQAYEDRIIRFTSEYRDKGVQVVAISPTSPYGLLPEECGYSDLDDSYGSMQARAKDKAFNFPYLYDGDEQEASVRYGPTATPHAFVFGRDRKLAYAGRIDASEKPGTADAEDLRAAVDAVLEDRTVENPVTRAFGCSIKWSWKTEWTDRVNREWEAKKVMLEKIDTAWNGALPYSLLIEPGGNIIYAVQGAVDLPEMKRTIVEHPLMGRYY